MAKSARAKVTVNFSLRKGQPLDGLVGAASISRSYGGVGQDVGYAAETIARELAKSIRAANERAFFRVEAAVLAAEVAKGVDRELRKVGQFIATHLIGHPAGVGHGTTPIDKFEGEIEAHWKNLSLSTVRRKSANKNRFFLHEGGLRQDIKANVGAHLVKMNQGMVGRKPNGEVTHGPVRIRPYYHDPGGSRIYKIAEIEVNLFSQSRANRIASILNEDIFDDMSTTKSDITYLARRMGLSSQSIQKLMGPALTDRGRSVSREKRGPIYRPLLEPALAYFFTVRVPRAVDQTINKHRISEIR
ncbi:hypothetical protein [Mesorhizobium sp. WSM2239]|uniref:Uncharacterized protein n=2 Tax=unclassified Mesorhizobium TaxID=325217 RepID=A0AAU8DGV7_9HYPH